MQALKDNRDHRDPYSVARKRMISEQIVARGISDQRVLEIMGSIPRHDFVDDALKSQAYTDAPLSIGSSQTISQPYIVALMTQALMLSGCEKILEIGTGCGYQTVFLAMMGKQVHTIERFKGLTLAARKRFKELHLKNIVLRVSDGTQGWLEAAPFDRIIVTCAAPQVPQNLVSQLVVGGVMVIPVTANESEGSQKLLRITRLANNYKTEDLGWCHFVPMIGKHGYAEVMKT